MRRFQLIRFLLLFHIVIFSLLLSVLFKFSYGLIDVHFHSIFKSDDERILEFAIHFAPFQAEYFVVVGV